MSAFKNMFALVPLGADGKAAGQPILVGAGPLDGSNWSVSAFAYTQKLRDSLPLVGQLSQAF